MGQFFIRRPIVAIVIAILTVMMGVVTIQGLSVEQYPFLAPPNIRVTANYPGASAEGVEQSVATPIEQEVNGVDRLIYMKSSNTSDGRMQLDVNFEVGTDQDIANVLTQNRVSAAQARLPQEVTQQGVTVKKQSPSILMVISIFSPSDAYDANFLINYAGINLRDQLLRIPGIAQVDLFGGTDYGMRIWFQPDRLAKLGLTPADVISPSRSRTFRRPPARSAPRPRPRTSSSPTRSTPRAAWSRRRSSRTSSCARARPVRWCGSRTSAAPSSARRTTTPSGGSTASRPARWRSTCLPGANQLKAAETIYATMEKAKALFPPGMDYKIVYDTTPAVEASIDEHRAHVHRGADPGDAGRLHLPAEHPRDDHPAADDPGLPDRHLHLLPDAGLLDQHAVDVRPGAGHRHRRRRRHRRGRGGDPPPRARAEPEGGDDQGDGGGHGAGDRHRAHPLRGVHPRRPSSAGWSAACTSSSR